MSRHRLMATITPVATLLAALLVALSTPAIAYQVPDRSTGSSTDSRVRHVPYNTEEVTRVYAQRGISTQIVLDPKEHIVIVPTGDHDGWEVMAKKGDSNVYLKPRENAHDSNLLVHTDKRNYSFDVIVLPLGAKFGNDKVMYRVVFDYQPPGGLTPAVSPAQVVAQRLAVAKPVVRNARYSMAVMSESSDIVPSATWDDGRFTYIRIPANRAVPAVFRVDDDDSEHVVDKHMDGDVIVVHEVAKRFVLRLTNETVGLVNEAYDINGVPPKDGTTVDGVKRVMRSDSDE